MRAIYLTGDRIYLRAMLLSDKEHATAWFDSPFPIDSSRAESFLKEEHKNLFSRNRPLAIVELETDDVIGSVTLWTNGRESALTFTMAPWLDDADGLRAEALRIVIPWLRDEATMATTDLEIPADQEKTIAAADDLGMILGVRLREHIARPGCRVDLLYYQALGPAWVFDKETVNA